MEVREMGNKEKDKTKDSRRGQKKKNWNRSS